MNIGRQHNDLFKILDPIQMDSLSPDNLNENQDQRLTQTSEIIANYADLVSGFSLEMTRLYGMR
jgi:hypothetical protein